MGLAGFEKVQKGVSVEAQTQSLERIYEKVISQKRNFEYTGAIGDGPEAIEKIGHGFK